jgi:hypothetical protein
MDGTTAGNGPGPRTMYPVVKNVMLGVQRPGGASTRCPAKLMGFDPMSLPYIRMAHEDGLGVGDPRDIEIVGDTDSGAGELALPGRQEPRPVGGGDLIWFGPLKRFQKLFFPHPARQRLHPGQRRLPRLLPLAAGRPQGLRTLVRDDGVGPDVPALRAVRPAGRAD